MATMATRPNALQLPFNLAEKVTVPILILYYIFTAPETSSGKFDTFVYYSLSFFNSHSCYQLATWEGHLSFTELQ